MARYTAMAIASKTHANNKHGRRVYPMVALNKTNAQVPVKADGCRSAHDNRYDFEANRATVQQALDKLARRPLYRFAKRTLDVVASLLALIVLAPVFIIIAILIYIDDPHGSPVFVQTRVGQHERPFRFYKFRSMYVNAEARVKDLLEHNTFSGPVFKMDNDPRVTGIGAVLRKSSIDELPQLFNVLRGEMSLVGPRPPVVWEAKAYTPYQKLRLRAKPGLTCFWQVTPNKYSLAFDDYVALDIQYMKEQGFLTDILLIGKTVTVMLRRENA
jgi:lipopolysaccharide/colanic/teichoic acid biosynthesis glycosyltransferase